LVVPFGTKTLCHAHSVCILSTAALNIFEAAWEANVDNIVAVQAGDGRLDTGNPAEMSQIPTLTTFAPGFFQAVLGAGLILRDHEQLFTSLQ